MIENKYMKVVGKMFKRISMFLFVIILSVFLISCQKPKPNKNFEKHEKEIKQYLIDNHNMQVISGNKVSTPNAEREHDGLVMNFNNKTYITYITDVSYVNGVQVKVQKTYYYSFETGKATMMVATYHLSTNVLNDSSSLDALTMNFETNAQQQVRQDRFEDLKGLLNVIDIIAMESIGQTKEYFIIK